MTRIDDIIQQISELATVCSTKDQFGIIFHVRSDDHTPPHAHVFGTDKKKLGELLLVENTPRTIQDIQEYRPDNYGYFTREIKQRILKWANSTTKRGFNRWRVSLDMWDSMHTTE
jgi:hypothetical protein